MAMDARGGEQALSAEELRAQLRELENSLIRLFPDKDAQGMPAGAAS